MVVSSSANGIGAIHSYYRGRRPNAVQDLASRRVKPHRQIELILRRGQPIRFLVCTRRSVLDVEVQGTVGVKLELVAVTDSETIERIRHLKPVLVVKRHRPERFSGRKLAFVEVQHVAVGAVVRLAVT